MSADGQRTNWCRNIAENFNRLSRVQERYRQTDRRTTDDGRTTTYSERERLFTFELMFAKKFSYHYRKSTIRPFQ